MNQPTSIVEQHALATSVLWLRRRTLSVAPHVSLRDLATLDNQLDGNIEGLLLAGSVGWELCQAELQWEDEGDFFRAAVVAIAHGERDRFDVVQRAVRDRVELREAVSSACAWLAWDVAAEAVHGCLSSQDPFWRYAGMRAYELRQRDPGEELESWLDDDQPECRSLAARLVATLPRCELMSKLNRLSNDESLEVRSSALEARALRSSEPEIVQALLAIFESSDIKFQGRALRTLVSILPAQRADDLLNTLAGSGDERQLRLAAQMTGLLGIPDRIPWLIELLRHPPQARVAAEAISQITGLRLDQEPFETAPPADFEVGPNEDPEDENVTPDADENLPWVEPAAVSHWWWSNSQYYAHGVRHLLGYPLDDPAWLEKVLALGRQRERWVAAWELARRRPTAMKLDVGRHSREQLQILGMVCSPTEEKRCAALSAGPS